MRTTAFKLWLVAASVVGCSSSFETTDLKARVAALEAQNAALQEQVDYVALQLSQVSNSFKILESQYSDLRFIYGDDVPEIQAQLNILQLQVAVLNGYKAIVAFEDPCGDGPGYDEFLLRLSDGSVVAYFEQGNERFLTKLLPEVRYQTTDRQSCRFSVDIAGNLKYN
jgi:hypothetical protein